MDLLTKFFRILIGGEGIAKTDVIIFVLGPSGAGKSWFINTAAQKRVTPVHELETESMIPCTKDVYTAKCGWKFPWDEATRLVFVDGPCFGSDNNQIAGPIKNWVKKNLKAPGIKFGILYLHRMNPRMNERPRDHLIPFLEICKKFGHPAKNNILLVPTQRFLGKSQAEGYDLALSLEEELLTTFRSTSKETANSEKVYFDGRYESARAAIDTLLEKLR